MGNKIKLVAIIIGGVIFVYVFLLAIMPIFVDVTTTANATITASSNWTDYPGAQAVLVGAPLWIFFIPGIVGIASIVLVLKRKER